MGGQLIFAYIISMFQTAATAIGGAKGAILRAVADTAALIQNASEDVKESVLPWFAWANTITKAERNPTDDELAASRNFRDTVHEQNGQLVQGAKVEDLPPLPLPPGWTRDADGNPIGPDGQPPSLPT